MEFLTHIGISSERISDALWSALPHVIAAFAVVIFFVILYVITSRILRSVLSRAGLQKSLIDITVSSLYKWIITIFALIMALNQLGVDVTAAIAGVGVAGIAIGFAAKETLSNVLAGFSIFIDKLYKRGDWVEVAGQYGQVKHINLRTTKIRNLDNIFVIVPNAEITNAPVTNFSEEGMVRVTTKIGIAYEESIEAAREAIMNAIQDIDGVRSDPAPHVVVDELADSSVNLLVRIWVDDAGTDPKYRFLLNEVCKKALDEAGIEIPFPQREVNIKNS